MTLIKDLIAIPEKVQRGDFVLNLASGLEADAVDQTLAQYVVTPQLAKAFDDALSFIQSAVTGGQNRNKGAYLHGSFGSGKSHFMAVLHLLLQGNPTARAIPELAPVIARHSEWMQSRNILLVPYHMIGASSIEAGVLGGYARYVRARHQDAPVPGFYMADRLFRDAQELRGRLGDEKFFAALNEVAGGGRDEGWGEMAGGWDAATFEAVLDGQGGEDGRTDLVGDLVGSLFTSFADMANTQSGGYVEFDEGLRIMTAHAKALGYDAVILFLDELILWLASRLSDKDFIGTQVQKVVKLVETGIPRALPLVSFIARQRDLREFVGEHYSGMEQEVLSDSLKYWDGRFHTITLEDRNLPVVAERRLLAPVSKDARQQIDEAFAKTERMREEAFNFLLTSQGDRQMFRQLYPFSPALVQALVALSSALQRERTALKVMLMLLVEQRERLTLGLVIPVGDLYDVIASEAEPFSEQMRQQFDNAKGLLERKLIPLLCAENGVEAHSVQTLPAEDTRRMGFENDLRLLKTLLLAALVPEVEALKLVTPAKLAALNHGTIRSPIPGREAQTVLQKCRRWAGQVGEIKISDDASPLIGIQLSGVDTESIIEKARINDNAGNRRRLIKTMVFDEFGIHEEPQLFVEHEFLWRGTRRQVEVLFQNIREIDDFSVFEARGDDWKVIVDFPFDEGNHSPMDDQARVRLYEERGESTRTLCWLPYFFTPAAQRNLGKLVILEDILRSDDRFIQYSNHLNQIDRAQARTLLDNQRSQLHQQVRSYLIGAYGVGEPLPGSVDDNAPLELQIRSLDPGFKPKLPHGTTLGKAFEQLLGQALAHQYPDHPEFDSEVKLVDLGKVLGELRRAIHAENGRIEVDSPLRPLMRQIAQPLKLGEMHERHFIFKPDWPQHLAREAATTGGDITVAALRQAMDRPQPRGLPTMVQNLLIMVFAEHGKYAFTLHGGPYDDITLKDIRDELVLVKQALAEPQTWRKALEHAAALFGISDVRPLHTANNQNQLEKAVIGEVKGLAGPCQRLLTVLRERCDALGLGREGNRLRNAQLAVSLLDILADKEGVALIEALAQLSLATSVQALAKSMATAARVGDAVVDNNWELLQSVWHGADPDAAGIEKRVREVLEADELATALAPVLKQAQADATRIVTRQRTPEPAPPQPPTPPEGGGTLVKQGSRRGLTAREARTLLAEIEHELRDGVRVDISYAIVTEGAK